MTLTPEREAAIRGLVEPTQGVVGWAIAGRYSALAFRQAAVLAIPELLAELDRVREEREFQLAASRKGITTYVEVANAGLKEIKQLRVALHEALNDYDSAMTEVYQLRELTETCSCPTVFPEGPMDDCAVHGAIRAHRRAVAEIEKLRTQLADMHTVLTSLGIHYVTPQTE